MVSPSPSTPAAAPTRLTRDDRHDSLLDVAAGLLAQGGLAAVTMDAVAAGAGVSRPLVYKHFRDREALLAGLWRREAAAIDARTEEAVRDAVGFEAVLRASVAAALDAVDRSGFILAPFLHSELFDRELRREQLARYRRIRTWYAQLIIDEFGLTRSQAATAVTVHLTGLDSMVADCRSARRDRSEMADVYVRLVMGGLRALQRHDG